MTGNAYYVTTLADWQRHSPRFATSHFIVLDDAHAWLPPQITRRFGRRLESLGWRWTPYCKLLRR